MIATEDCVITEFTGTGTHDGVLETPNGKISPTHKKINIPFVEVLQFKNGKITSSNLYYDTVTIMQQLGLTEGKGDSESASMGKNKSAVENFFSSMRTPEHKTYCESYFHKEHKLHFPLFENTLNAIEHFKMDEEFLKGFPDVKIENEDIFTAGEKVVLRGRLTGTNNGEFNNIPATGKRLDLPFIAIMKFENGKNIEEWVEMDTSKMLKQLGAGS
jgi:predicted ester cyclase